MNWLSMSYQNLLMACCIFYILGIKYAYFTPRISRYKICIFYPNILTMAVRFYKNWPQTFPLITCHLFNALQHTGIPAVCPTSETTMLAVVPVWNIPPLNTHGSHSCSSFWFLSWPRLPVRVLRETEPNSLLVCVCVCVCVCVTNKHLSRWGEGGGGGGGGEGSRRRMGRRKKRRQERVF